MTPSDYATSVARAQEAAAAYYNGTGLTMTDAEYDALLDAVEAHETANPADVIAHGLFDSVAAGATVTADVSHPTRMLSLDKVTDDDDVHKFVERVANEQTPAERAADPVLTLTPKLDGMAVRAVYRDGRLVQVVTRGNGSAGEDVTERLMRGNVVTYGLPDFVESKYGVPSHADFEVRGEMLMTTDDFRASNANRVAAGKAAFVNPRNATAGTVRAETLDYDVELTFVTYSHDGIPVECEGSFIFADELDGAASFTTDDIDDLLAAVDEFGTRRAGYDYPTDGVVIAVNSDRIRDELGEGSRAPKWAVAYKYGAVTGESTVREIEVAVGRTGNLSFTAVFDPVLVDGSTIGRASVHNVALIQDKDIRIGSVVEVGKRGDIIPQIVQVVSNGPETTKWTPPTEDAEGFPYEMQGAFLRSTNPADSVSALIAYAGSRDVLDIDTLGRSVADALVEAELVSDLGDLFAITEATFAAMPFGDTAFGDTRAKTLFENIQKSKEQPLNRFITALGIRKSGRTFGRRLMGQFHTFDALIAAAEADFFTVEGVGDERARLFHEGFQRNRSVIEKLRTAGANMGTPPQNDGATRPLEGMAVVVSGGMTGSLAGLNRNEVQELIESLGGRASSSVSKTTALLVTGETTTSKAVKAASLGVKVVSPEEFATLIGR